MWVDVGDTHGYLRIGRKVNIRQAAGRAELVLVLLLPLWNGSFRIPCGSSEPPRRRLHSLHREFLFILPTRELFCLYPKRMELKFDTFASVPLSKCRMNGQLDTLCALRRDKIVLRDVVMFILFKGL